MLNEPEKEISCDLVRCTAEMQVMQNGNKQIDGLDGAVRRNWTVAAEAKSLMFIGVRPLGDARSVAPAVNTRLSHRG
jgi:hypothetical protein